MYRAYHMDSPEVFYNREDLWNSRASRRAARTR